MGNQLKRRLDSEQVDFGGIFIANDDGVLVVLGQCSSCKGGTRSLVLQNYIPNAEEPGGIVHLKCMECGKKHIRDLQEVSR